jgi:hypothetical protein
MEMLTSKALMATWTQMQARSAEKRTGHRAIPSLEKGNLYFNHRLFYFWCAFLRGEYLAVAISHHSFEFPFSFSYEFLLCVCYFGRQIDTPLRAGIACRLTSQVKSRLEDLWERVRCQ